MHCFGYVRCRFIRKKVVLPVPARPVRKKTAIGVGDELVGENLLRVLGVDYFDVF